jgi:hypothetical protein
MDTHTHTHRQERHREETHRGETPRYRRENTEIEETHRGERSKTQIKEDPSSRSKEEPGPLRDTTSEDPSTL